MGRRVRYIGSFSVKTLHALFNNTMLKLLCREFPGEVICHASKSALRHLDTSGCAKVSKLYVYAGNGKPSVLFRYMLSLFHNIRILLLSKKSDILFYNYNNVFALRALDFLNRRLRRDIVICCHGEMEFLSLPAEGLHSYKRVMSALVRGYFNPRSEPAPGMRFIVLGDVILKNMRPYLSQTMYSRFLSLDHPFETPVLQADTTDRTFTRKGRNLNVGTIGILNEHKGSDSYLRLIRSINARHLPITFHTVGHIQCDPEPFRKEGVVMASRTNEPLPPAQFADAVSNLDYLLFFYGKDKYRLTASGALLDAVRFRKPIIALRNEYFDYFFSKFGKVGYLADSIEEMERLLLHPDRLCIDFDFDGIVRKLIGSSDSFRLQHL